MQIRNVEVIVVVGRGRVSGEVVQQARDERALVVPPGRAVQGNLRPRIAGLNRLVSHLHQLDVILDRSVPGCPLAGGNIHFIPDDPAVDAAGVNLGELLHDIQEATGQYSLEDLKRAVNRDRNRRARELLRQWTEDGDEGLSGP